MNLVTAVTREVFGGAEQMRRSPRRFHVGMRQAFLSDLGGRRVQYICSGARSPSAVARTTGTRLVMRTS